MSEILLTINHVSKTFPKIGRHGAGLAALMRVAFARPQTEGFRALKDIDFHVRRGESFSLVGENGAGKSTLLKIIAGVLQPSQGNVTRVGTVGALLELGAGFHPEYTGRENLKLAAALQGLAGAAFDAKLGEIIAFADIGEHIAGAGRDLRHVSFLRRLLWRRQVSAGSSQGRVVAFLRRAPISSEKRAGQSQRLRT